MNLEIFDRISSEFKKIGFRFVAIDVDGYRTGALNEILTQISKLSQMKILVVGSGGREHAVVDALSQSPESSKIYRRPRQRGIRAHAELVPSAADDVWSLLEFARNETIDLTFVGPGSAVKQRHR